MYCQREGWANGAWSAVNTDHKANEVQKHLVSLLSFRWSGTLHAASVACTRMHVRACVRAYVRTCVYACVSVLVRAWVWTLKCHFSLREIASCFLSTFQRRKEVRGTREAEVWKKTTFSNEQMPLKSLTNRQKTMRLIATTISFFEISQLLPLLWQANFKWTYEGNRLKKN